jgi:oxygen-dependent protoporphyrinogen oxidase
MRRQTGVVIVGGGISGLAAAHTLTRLGTPFILLEGGDRVGGVIRTEREAGVLLEAGPDAFISQKPEAVALCRELGLAAELVPTNPDQRTVYVLRGGRLHALPDGMVLGVPTRLGPFVTSRLFSWRGKLRMGLEALVPRRHETADESLGAFLRRRFGTEALERMGDPLLGGIHAGDPDHLSVRATFPRFAEMEAKSGSLIRAFARARRHAPATIGPGFYSLRGGLSDLARALAAALPAGSVRLRSSVSGIARDGRGFTVITAQGDVVQARALVLAIPAHRAAPLMRAIDPAVAEALASVRFVSTATVLLGYRRDQVGHRLDGYGLMVPRTEGLHTNACSFVSTKFPERAPAGHVLLRGFLGGMRDTLVLNHSDEELAGFVVQELGSVLRIGGDPVVARVFRWPHSTPQLEVGHLERMAKLEVRLAALPGLFLTGAGLRGTGIPDGVADGQRTARVAADHVSLGPAAAAS